MFIAFTSNNVCNFVFFSNTTTQDLYFSSNIFVKILKKWYIGMVKNTVQALKYLSAHAVTLYMPGFKAIN